MRSLNSHKDLTKDFPTLIFLNQPEVHFRCANRIPTAPQTDLSTTWKTAMLANTESKKNSSFFDSSWRGIKPAWHTGGHKRGVQLEPSLPITNFYCKATSSMCCISAAFHKSHQLIPTRRTSLQTALPFADTEGKDAQYDVSWGHGHAGFPGLVFWLFVGVFWLFGSGFF